MSKISSDLALFNELVETLISEVIKPGCIQIIKVLNKIQDELEGTQQFISELKRIN